jgi:hypothetical protein
MKSFLHLNVRIHHWVLWWVVFGIICGIVALINILEHNFSRVQERILIAVGIYNWILGGLICFACEGIRIEQVPPLPGQRPAETETKASPAQDREWHAASDFLLPGNRKSLLPPRCR